METRALNGARPAAAINPPQLAALLVTPCPKCSNLRGKDAAVVEQIRRLTVDVKQWQVDEGHDKTLKTTDTTFLVLGDIHCDDCRDTGYIPTALGDLLLNFMRTYAADARPLTGPEIAQLESNVPF